MRHPPRKIVILRALKLGDLLCAVPAFRSLRRSFPEAEIVLVGLPWAREFVERYSCYLNGFREFPGYPGLPEREPDLGRLPAFFEGIRAERFDLALQMHGSGVVSNAIVARLGASIQCGFYDPHTTCPSPATFLPYPDRGLELRRLLHLLAHLGVPPCGEWLEFPVSSGDRDRALGLRRDTGLGARRYACIHAGASVPERRWPPERFAAVADALADRGLAVVLTGTESEAGLTAGIAGAMRSRAIDLAGKTSLGTLAALLERARLLVCNDTSASHLADALRRPSVVISTGENPDRWAPADGRLHRVLCRDDGVAVDEVIAQVDDLLGGSSESAPRGHRPIGGDATASIGQQAGGLWRTCDGCAS